MASKWLRTPVRDGNNLMDEKTALRQLVERPSGIETMTPSLSLNG